VAWFLGQSLLIIIAAILLGLLVGWLLWGRLVLRRYRIELAEKDAELTQLRAQLAARERVEAAAKPGPATEPEPVAEPVTEVEAAPVTEVEAEPVTEVEAAPVTEVEAEPVTDVEAAPVAEVEAAPEPVAAGVETVPEPTPVAVAVEEPDDLERIEGIGPKMAGALNQAGIRTYAQLADADEPTLRAAIAAAKLSFAPSLTTWSRQARLLADGDEEGFADLVRRLVAGRDVGRP
jgi:predicted flap endonuclease-1-like 5' DNA nuclease